MIQPWEGKYINLVYSTRPTYLLKSECMCSLSRVINFSTQLTLSWVIASTVIKMNIRFMVCKGYQKTEPCGIWWSYKAWRMWWTFFLFTWRETWTVWRRHRSRRFTWKQGRRAVNRQGSPTSGHDIILVGIKGVFTRGMAPWRGTWRQRLA